MSNFSFRTARLSSLTISNVLPCTLVDQTVSSRLHCRLRRWSHSEPLGSSWRRDGTARGARSLFLDSSHWIFVVWLPAVLVAEKLVGTLNRKDFWKVVLKNSPVWMRSMVYGFFGYALINFLLFIAKAPASSSGANPPAAVWRGFSGHWMAFYSAALAILCSAARHQASFDRG
jgi:hypothetical protein